MQKTHENSYWRSSQFATASQYYKNASGVVMLLGTNDSKESVWNSSEFYTDYSSMLMHFKNFESRYLKVNFIFDTVQLLPYFLVRQTSSLCGDPSSYLRRLSYQCT